ncbi:hypothetical protein [Halonotius roseus]|uniref:Uncharacterized protein n=1 Tax=Halonotius roseus TaxID=2511997 RepID=A0A544QPA7_9EURY|nr:hypothetical protein [Halonotius roseus]TQQ80705.1 hypothetical protein EWF95_09505 [Halonotius roseus]
MFERFDEAKTEKRPPNHRSGDADRHYLTAVAVGAAARAESDTPFDDDPFDSATTGGVDV